MFDAPNVGCERVRAAAGDITEFAAKLIRCGVGSLCRLRTLIQVLLERLRRLLLLVFLTFQMVSIWLESHHQQQQQPMLIIIVRYTSDYSIDDN